MCIRDSSDSFCMSIAFEEIAADKIEGISVDLDDAAPDLVELVGDDATAGD